MTLSSPIIPPETLQNLQRSIDSADINGFKNIVSSIKGISEQTIANAKLPSGQSLLEFTANSAIMFLDNSVTCHHYCEIITTLVKMGAFTNHNPAISLFADTRISEFSRLLNISNTEVPTLDHNKQHDKSYWLRVNDFSEKNHNIFKTPITKTSNADILYRHLWHYHKLQLTIDTGDVPIDDHSFMMILYELAYYPTSIKTEKELIKLCNQLLQKEPEFEKYAFDVGAFQNRFERTLMRLAKDEQSLSFIGTHLHRFIALDVNAVQELKLRLYHLASDFKIPLPTEYLSDEEALECLYHSLLDQKGEDPNILGDDIKEH